MIQQSPESKQPLKEMLAKVTGMSAIRMPSKTIRLGKEHAQLVVADITIFPDIWHKLNLSNNKVPGTRHNIKVKDNRDIEMMMEILP
jgi:hypothetical protein